MNRRTFATTALAAGLLPGTAMMNQQATPQVQPLNALDAVDARTRDLTATLAAISPTALLEALESADVTNEVLIEANGGDAPTSVPWADYGDTDLYSSLGGVGLTSGGMDLSDPDTGMLGAYIVYESAEISYHEFVRKIGDIYESPMSRMSVAGTNVWIVESGEMQIGTWRIGNVMMMAMLSGQQGSLVEGIIGHLDDVATSLAS